MGHESEGVREVPEVAGLELGLVGTHNLQNALGTIAAVTSCGVSPEEACAHLASFPGAKRRMERIGTYNGVLILDDFSHHPSEVAGSIGVLKSVVPEGRVIVVFQPHRYARTRILKDDFGRLSLADRVFVTAIYGVRARSPRQRRLENGERRGAGDRAQ